MTARAPGKSAKQANTGRMAINIVLRFFIFFDFLFIVLAVRELSLKEELQGLFTITLVAGLLISSCAFTFWICAAFSFSWAVRVPNVDFSSAMLACCSSIF